MTQRKEIEQLKTEIEKVITESPRLVDVANIIKKTGGNWNTTIRYCLELVLRDQGNHKGIRGVKMSKGWFFWSAGTIDRHKAHRLIRALRHGLSEDELAKIESEGT